MWRFPDIPPPALSHPTYQRHYHWMTRAMVLAYQAGEAGEVPVGAVIVHTERNVWIAEGENRRERDRDPTAHAEIIALRQAGISLKNWHLNDCTLYVTLEPCPMCAGAIVLARLGTLVYGADDLKTGAIRTVINVLESPSSNHHPAVFGGILADPCRQQLQSWFAARRQCDRPPSSDPSPQ